MDDTPLGDEFNFDAFQSMDEAARQRLHAKIIEAREQEWFNGVGDPPIGLFAYSARPDSAHWSNKTPAQILEDVNALLAYNHTTPAPSRMYITPQLYWAMLRYPTLRRLELGRGKSKRHRRPLAFTRRLSRKFPVIPVRQMTTTEQMVTRFSGVRVEARE